MIGTAIATAGRILWRMLERRGIDPAPVFKEAGLDTNRLDNPLLRYPAKEASLAWMRASELLDDPAFGLTIAEVWHPSDFHALGCAFMASSTLRDALNRLVRFNPVVYDLVSYSLAEHGARMKLSYNPVHGKLDEPAILEDTRWAVVLDACRRVFGANLNPLEVTFWHSRPASGMDAFLDYFRCPLHFGEPVASMTFPTELLDRQLPAANRELALALDLTLSDYLAKLRHDDIVSRTKLAIADNLPSGNLSSGAVAAGLYMSPRSLQRKLLTKGTSYRKLVNAVRRELAESYLAKDDIAPGEVSYLLGFSSQASFSRAFKRWTGLSPGAFRGAA
jgi:AraC-like DNA-binding protein